MELNHQLIGSEITCQSMCSASCHQRQLGGDWSESLQQKPKRGSQLILTSCIQTFIHSHTENLTILTSTSYLSHQRVGEALGGPTARPAEGATELQVSVNLLTHNDPV